MKDEITIDGVVYVKKPPVITSVRVPGSSYGTFLSARLDFNDDFITFEMNGSMRSITKADAKLIKDWLALHV